MAEVGEKLGDAAGGGLVAFDFAGPAVLGGLGGQLQSAGLTSLAGRLGARQPEPRRAGRPAREGPRGVPGGLPIGVAVVVLG